MKAALVMQVVWFALAIGYNCLSLGAIAGGEPGFAGGWADTTSALIAVVLFGVITLIGFLRNTGLYRILALVVSLMLLGGGVLKHVFLGPELYASYFHWLAAILINAVGVIAYAVGAGLAFRSPETAPQ